MKRSRLTKIIAILLCSVMLLPSCGLRRKETTSKTKQTEEEDEEEDTTESSDDAQVTPDAKVLMHVDSLDEFISDGSIFAENVPVATPTPIPVKQTTLGLTNEDDGYFSGPLENATIVDNEYFRFTIVSAVTSDTGYVVTSEFENKTDVPYRLFYRNPIMNNSCTEWYFYTDEEIEPYSVYTDVSDFASVFDDFDGTEPTRLTFLLLAVPITDGLTAVLAQAPDSDDTTLNYIPVTLFPQGEDAFVYEDAELGPESTIMYDSEGAEFVIDYFDATDSGLYVHYTFINKTDKYIQLRLDGGITLDKTVFDAGSQAVYIPPYGRQSSDFRVEGSKITAAGFQPTDFKSISIPLIASSLNDGIMVLWETEVRKEIDYG